MVDVSALSESDWDWLRRVLGEECVDDPERPGRLEGALALRGAGVSDDRVRGWVDVVDSREDRPLISMGIAVDRILDFDRRCIAPVDGGPWLLDDAPSFVVPQLLALGRTVEEYHQFTRAAWDEQNRFPLEGEESPAGLFIIRWLLCSNFPLDEALAYTFAGVLPEEALETWEPLRQSDPEKWEATLQFMAAMLASPDDETRPV